MQTLKWVGQPSMELKRGAPLLYRTLVTSLCSFWCCMLLCSARSGLGVLDWVPAGQVLVLLPHPTQAILSRADWLLLPHHYCLQHAHYIHLHACTLYYAITV